MTLTNVKTVPRIQAVVKSAAAKGLATANTLQKKSDVAGGKALNKLTTGLKNKETPAKIVGKTLPNVIKSTVLNNASKAITKVSTLASNLATNGKPKPANLSNQPVPLKNSALAKLTPQVKNLLQNTRAASTPQQANVNTAAQNQQVQPRGGSASILPFTSVQTMSATVTPEAWRAKLSTAIQELNNEQGNSFKIITALAKASPKQGLIVAVLDETLEIEKKESGMTLVHFKEDSIKQSLTYFYYRLLKDQLKACKEDFKAQGLFAPFKEEVESNP